MVPPGGSEEIALAAYEIIMPFVNDNDSVDGSGAAGT
jgi:hypothetical protein